MSDENHKCLHESDWAVMKDHVEDIGTDTKLVLKMLRGNGEPGIVTKLALQDQCMQKLHSRLDEIAEDQKVLRNRVWTALISVVILIVGSLIKYMIGV